MAERPIYVELAAAAHSAGFEEISPSQIHRWVRAGLIPKTAIQVSIGRGGFASIPQSGAADQLLALYRWRRATKSLAALTVLLWSEGWAIDSRRVRLALESWLPRTVFPGTTTGKQREDARWELSTVARRIAPMLRRKFGVRKLAPDDMADAADYILQTSLGLSRRKATHEEAVAIERLAGLHRARVDRIDGVDPWLSSPAEESTRVIPDLSLTAIARLVESASDEELALARSRLYFFVTTGAALAEAAELWGGREFGALHGLRIKPRDAVWGLILVLHLARIGLAETLDGMIEELGGTAIGREF